MSSAARETLLSLGRFFGFISSPPNGIHLKGQKVPLKFSSPINGCQRAEIPIQKEGALGVEKSSISLLKGIRESRNNALPKGSF